MDGPQELLEMSIESLSTRKCHAIMSDNVQLLSALPWEDAFLRLSEECLGKPGQEDISFSSVRVGSNKTKFEIDKKLFLI